MITLEKNVTEIIPRFRTLQQNFSTFKKFQFNLRFLTEKFIFDKISEKFQQNFQTNFSKNFREILKKFQ